MVTNFWRQSVKIGIPRFTGPAEGVVKAGTCIGLHDPGGSVFCTIHTTYFSPIVWASMEPITKISDE